jgi:hypothetical protein
MPKEKEVLQIPSIPFLNKEGKGITLDKVLSQEDYWLSRNRRGDSWIISHRGVEKIAKVAGIKPQINTEFELQVSPSYQNAMDREVVARMICEADLPLGKCVHGSDSQFKSTGEASRLNTGARGGSYMRIMAEKRAYDRGVLQHLELDEKVNIYSVEEAEGFEQEDKRKPDDEVIVKLSNIINEILNTKSKEELNQIAEKIRKQEYDLQELEYLKGLWLRQYNTFINTF